MNLQNLYHKTGHLYFLSRIKATFIVRYSVFSTSFSIRSNSPFVYFTFFRWKLGLWETFNSFCDSLCDWMHSHLYLHKVCRSWCHDIGFSSSLECLRYHCPCSSHRLRVSLISLFVMAENLLQSNFGFISHVSWCSLQSIPRNNSKLIREREILNISSVLY